MIDVDFTCYYYSWASGEGGACTLFLFYPKGYWDEYKLTLQEAVDKYPPEKYNWIFCEDI